MDEQKKPELSPLISTSEAARLIGVSVRFMNYLTRLGYLTYVKKDGYIWLERKKVDTFRNKLIEQKRLNMKKLTELTEKMGLYD